MSAFSSLLAILIAVVSDAIDLVQVPLLTAPAVVFAENVVLTVLDIVTAFALALLLGRFNKLMIPIVLLEAMPVISIFPSWTLFVISALRQKGL